MAWVACRVAKSPNLLLVLVAADVSSDLWVDLITCRRAMSGDYLEI